MKIKFIVCIIFLLVSYISNECFSQTSLSYFVKRGDTWESIAKQFELTIEELKKANKEFDKCYVGLEIDIPISDETPQMIEERLLVSRNSLYIKAERLFDDGMYAKAIKVYDEILESHSASNYAFLKRGIANYKTGKYKKALKDLGHVLTAYDHNYDEAQNYNKLALRELARIKEKKADFWSGLGASVAIIGATAAYTYAAKQQAEMMQNSNAGSYNLNGGGQYENVVSDVDNDTSANTAVDMNNSGRKKCQIRSVNDKIHCNGTGVCVNCNGKGEIFSTDFGIAEYRECTYCNGTGKCYSCKGTGYEN